MILNRGINIRNSSHIILIWRYIRNVVYMDELGVNLTNNKKNRNDNEN